MSSKPTESMDTPGVGRRGLLTNTAAGILMFTSRGAFAEELVRTPRQTEGPFYPDHLPLDTDNDLVVINDSLTPAVGAITYLSGRILNHHGDPVRNAVVEIWQVDSRGSYLHSKGANPDTGGARDKNFQGFGRFLTGSTGEYLFRTIKPVKYPGRAPHIHVAVKMKGHARFTTQCYIQGDPGNTNDQVLKAVLNPRARQSVIVPFAPMPDSRIGELTAKFDIVHAFVPTG